MLSDPSLHLAFIGGVGGLLLVLVFRASMWSAKLALLGMALGIFVTLSQGYAQLGFMIGFALPLVLIGVVVGFLIDLVIRPKKVKSINSSLPSTTPTLKERSELHKIEQENFNVKPVDITVTKLRTSSPRPTQVTQPIRIVTFMERLELERKEAVFKERLYKFLVVVMLLIPVGTLLYALFA